MKTCTIENLTLMQSIVRSEIASIKNELSGAKWAMEKYRKDSIAAYKAYKRCKKTIAELQNCLLQHMQLQDNLNNR